MIEIFKTNVQEEKQSRQLIERLLYHLPNSKINFDLNDCDKILRIEAENFSHQTVIDLLKENGCNAEVLD